MRRPTCLVTVLAAAGLVPVLVGCGGTGHEGRATEGVQFGVYWSERSRAGVQTVAPSSALSFTLTLARAAIGGSDYIFTADRRPGPGAYSRAYALPGRVRVGPTTLSVRFYAGPGGTGDVVGVGYAAVRVRADGSGLGDVGTAGAVASVEVPPGQTLAVGQTKDLAFTVHSDTGALLAVTPGSVFWSVVDGPAFLRFDKASATGVARGEAGVAATVDGKTSARQAVRVTGQARGLLLGRLPGAPSNGSSGALGISADAKVVVGFSWSGEGLRAFRWTEAGGMENLGTLPGFRSSLALATDADGSAVVGTCSKGDNAQTAAFRWSAATGMRPIIDWPEGRNHSAAFDVSADGAVIVGSARTQSGMQGFIWDARSGQSITLGDLVPFLPGHSFCQALGVSDDGRVVVGEARVAPDVNGLRVTQAFRWTPESGMAPLGTLYPGTFVSQAASVSGDGRVVTGASAGANGPSLFEPFRWTAAGGMVPLIPGGMGVGIACSRDGSVVLGNTSMSTDSQFLWDETHGLQSLGLLMQEAGITLPGNSGVLSASGLSADGRSIAGVALTPQGLYACLVELP